MEAQGLERTPVVLMPGIYFIFMISLTDWSGLIKTKVTLKVSKTGAGV
jgi:hypothetical protein